MSSTTTPGTPALGSSHRRLSVLHVSVASSDAVAALITAQVRDQVARGWHVSVACPSEGRLGYDVRAAGGRAHWWDAERGTGPAVIGETARLTAILEATNPDVVHLHGAKAGLVGRLAVRDGVPTIYSPGTWSFLAGGTETKADALRWERFAARWTAGLVCTDETERRIGQEQGIEVDSIVIPPGVDLDAFPAQGETERRAARAALGLRPVPTVVCVGRLALHKGQQDLLSDWPAIRERVPQAELILVGDGPDRDSLVGQAARLRGVSLTGPRSDVPSWYAAADVVVCPSRWEGTGLTALEAMASSRSVVVTAVPRLVDAVPEEAGAVVTPDDAGGLVDAVALRLADAGLTEDEGWNGRTHVEVNHDAKKSAHELSRLYLRVVGSRRSR